jgi:excisionase family DNA binding protein
MKNKHPGLEQEEFVSISEASHLLGVNEVTLRQWTDEGKLKAFITPGGHRRYSISDLKKFTRSSRKMLGVKDLAVEIEDTSVIHREIARKFLQSHPNCQLPGPDYQKHLAELGRHLLDLLGRYVCEPSNRMEIIDSARQIGAEFGKALAGLGLPLTDSVSAFLSHRDPFMNAAIHLLSKRQMVRGSLMEAIPLANRFIDETLICMISAHQQYSGKSEQ